MTDLCAYNFRKMILEAINVSKKFKDKNALSEVTVSVAKGSAFGLLGPNGAGKTTLIRCATNITKFDSGQILLNRKEVSEKEIMKIGYLPEERGLYKDFSVEEQIVYLSRLKGLSKNTAKERCRFWLKKLDLLNTAKRKTGSLSKGMQQKIQFIVAVIHEPSLLILDEPFSGFDPINSEQIKNEIQELRNNGTTIIFSSHNMASVEELCSDIALLNDGKIILNGSITEIKRRFSDDSFVITYDNDSVSLSNSNLYSITEFKEKSVTVKKNSGVSTNQLIVELSKDFEITSFNKKESSLNEIFIRTIETTKQQVNLL